MAQLTQGIDGSVGIFVTRLLDSRVQNARGAGDSAGHPNAAGWTRKFLSFSLCVTWCVPATARRSKPFLRLPLGITCVVSFFDLGVTAGYLLSYGRG